MKAEVGIVACLSAVDDLLWDPYINHGRFHAVHNACHYTLIFFFYIHLLLLFGTLHAYACMFLWTAGCLFPGASKQ